MREFLGDAPAGFMLAFGLAASTICAAIWIPYMFDQSIRTNAKLECVATGASARDCAMLIDGEWHDGK